MVGEPGKKIANIRSNPNVAIGIYHPMDHSKHNRSLQIRGKAKLINLTSHRREFLGRAEQFGISLALEKGVRDAVKMGYVRQEEAQAERERRMKVFNFIRVDPTEITYLSIHPTKGAEKDTWTKRSQARAKGRRKPTR